MQEPASQQQMQALSDTELALLKLQQKQLLELHEQLSQIQTHRDRTQEAYLLSSANTGGNQSLSMAGSESQQSSEQHPDRLLEQNRLLRQMFFQGGSLQAQPSPPLFNMNAGEVMGFGFNSLSSHNFMNSGAPTGTSSTNASLAGMGMLPAFNAINGMPFSLPGNHQGQSRSSPLLRQDRPEEQLPQPLQQPNTSKPGSPIADYEAI